MKKKTVYIAIEIKVREFISQVFLSSLLINNGYRVYLGSKDQIFNLIKNKREKGGIFFYKAGVTSKYVDLINNKTDKHIVFDQELLPGNLSGKSAEHFYLKNINCFSTIGEKFCDGYLATNRIIFNAAKKGLKKLRGKIYQTGSPRIDLWKKKYHHIYDNEVDKIKKKYGKFFLFNSDYQFITGNINEEVSWFFFNSKDLKEWSAKKYSDVIETEYDRAKNQYKEFVKFVPFLKKLSKITNKKIVIRPHPAENKFVWKKLFRNETNIFIEDPIKDVFPWILACEGLLHRGCTTSLQSLMIGKPTFFIDLGKDFKVNQEFKIFSYNNSVKIKENFKKNILSKLKSNTLNKKKFFLNYLGIHPKKDSIEKILEIFEKFKIQEEEKIKIKKNTLYNEVMMIYFLSKRILYKIYLFISFKKKIERTDLGKFDKIYGGIASIEVKYYMKKIRKKNNFLVQNVINDVVMIESR